MSLMMPIRIFCYVIDLVKLVWVESFLFNLRLLIIWIFWYCRARFHYVLVYDFAFSQSFVKFLVPTDLIRMHGLTAILYAFMLHGFILCLLSSCLLVASLFFLKKLMIRFILKLFGRILDLVRMILRYFGLF